MVKFSRDCLSVRLSIHLSKPFRSRKFKFSISFSEEQHCPKRKSCTTYSHALPIHLHDCLLKSLDACWPRNGKLGEPIFEWHQLVVWWGRWKRRSAGKLSLDFLVLHKRIISSGTMWVLSSHDFTERIWSRGMNPIYRPKVFRRIIRQCSKRDQTASYCNRASRD